MKANKGRDFTAKSAGTACDDHKAMKIHGLHLTTLISFLSKSLFQNALLWVDNH